jgi:NADPH:quinone reductase-like Zn-dependent oxidoreductase
MLGITKDGGFAEYCLVDARTSAVLPDSMSFEQAAPLQCAGVTIYAAIKKAEQCGVKPGAVGFVPLTRKMSTLIDGDSHILLFFQTLGFMGEMSRRRPGARLR